MWPFKKRVQPELSIKVSLSLPQNFTIHVRHHFDEKGRQEAKPIRSGSSPSGDQGSVADSVSGARAESLLSSEIFKDQQIPEVKFGEETDGR